MKRTILAVALMAAFGLAHAAEGGEGNNTGCNGVGNPNSPCVGGNGNVVNPVVNPVINPVISPIIAPTDNSVTINEPVAVSNGGSNELNFGASLGVSGSSNSGATATSGSSNATANGGKASIRDSGNSASSAGVKSSGNVAGQATNTVNNSTTWNDKQAASTAYAPTIVTGSDQCLVAASGGGQGFGFGISVGTAVPDRNCELLKLSKRLQEMGFSHAALRLLACNDERVRKVVGVSKEECEQDF